MSPGLIIFSVMRKKKDDEKQIIACMRIEKGEQGTSAGHEATCKECGHLVWIGDTVEKVADPGYTILCHKCVTSHMDVDDITQIPRPAKEQIEELRKHGISEEILDKLENDPRYLQEILRKIIAKDKETDPAWK